MPPDIELLPNQPQSSRPVFANEQEYADFRESFVNEVIPQQQEWLEVRRKSEEQARQRFVR
jgi:hypothetical protein